MKTKNSKLELTKSKSITPQVHRATRKTARQWSIVRFKSSLDSHYSSLYKQVSSVHFVEVSTKFPPDGIMSSVKVHSRHVEASILKWQWNLSTILHAPPCNSNIKRSAVMPVVPLLLQLQLQRRLPAVAATHTAEFVETITIREIQM